MGIEIKSNLLLSGRYARPTLVILIIAILLFNNCLKTFSQEVGRAYLPDNQTLVRVGISNNNFKSLVYSEISLIATSDYAVYDKNTARPVVKLNPDEVLKIKMMSGNFELSVNNKIVAKDLKDILVLDCPKGLIGVENHKRNGKQAFYHGVFEITPKNESQFYLVNVLDLDSYLKGVVPNEMPVRFGLEALKAQAVAARNYVLMPRTRAYSQFDVDDSVASQVYFGAATESSLSNQAVDETRGLVALYGWDLILAQYCSTAGGYTENYENAFSDPKSKIFPSKEKPYLKGSPDMLSVGPLNREEEARIFYMSYPDAYDMKSPYYRWKREFERAELEKTLSQTLIAQSKTGFVHPEFRQGDVFGELRELKVVKRGVSGKIMELEIITDKGSWRVQKELVVRRLLQKDGKALPSANVVFENLYCQQGTAIPCTHGQGEIKKLVKIVAYGGGYGHGVGMSQYGAGFMAVSLHKSFDLILKRYYTGITISTVPVILSSNAAQNVVKQEFFAPYKKAVLVVDNKYNLDYFNVNINGKDEIIRLEKNINPLNRINRIDISNLVKQGKNTVVFKFPGNEANKGLRLYIELVEKEG